MPGQGVDKAGTRETCRCAPLGPGGLQRASHSMGDRRRARGSGYSAGSRGVTVHMAVPERAAVKGARSSHRPSHGCLTPWSHSRVIQARRRGGGLRSRLLFSKGAGRTLWDNRDAVRTNGGFDVLCRGLLWPSREAAGVAAPDACDTIVLQLEAARVGSGPEEMP